MRSETITLTMWGAYRVVAEDGKLVAITPLENDPEPSSIGQSLLDTREHPVRITQPMIRAGYLKDGLKSDTSKRGSEPFVAVDWETAITAAADALNDTRSKYGNESIYGSSYGWASAGRFHHALSQLHRFLNMIGGYTASRNTYSMAAMEVILPHVIFPWFDMYSLTPGWNTIARHGELVVSFGGLPVKNTQVNVGGVSRHTAHTRMKKCRDAGVKFINISPCAKDISKDLDAEWLPIIPNTDTAMMMALAYVMIRENLVDEYFVNECCVGYGHLKAYILGAEDGQPKTPQWAEKITQVPANDIIKLARKMVAKRTFITVNWAVQRADHGEQPVWMAIALAAMCGSMGKPAGGFAVGASAIHCLGNDVTRLPVSSLPQGINPTGSFIPVAHVTEMLLNPGAPYKYDGQNRTYPDIHLIYWAGGNPFHHQMDLNRLVKGWQKPETVIIHDSYWTPATRHADIVFPSCTQLERNDIGIGLNEGTFIAMKQVLPPPGDSRSDYEIFTAIATRMGVGEAFTEGRDEEQWLRHLYDTTRDNCARQNIIMPGFDEFWQQNVFHIEPGPQMPPMCSELRADPKNNKIKTPSGKIELYSETIASFEYVDCPGHPVWLEPYEWLGSNKAKIYPLHLISNQPKTRLHSQLDFGRTSVNSKIKGREVCEMNPQDAVSRGIHDGDIIRLYNDRGCCLCAVRLTQDIIPGVLSLPTGAWFDPENPGEMGSQCVHGNPNVLTSDRSTSQLAQGPTAQSCLVQAEAVPQTDLPVVKIHQPPQIQ